MTASIGSAVPSNLPPAAALGVSAAGYRKFAASKKAKGKTQAPEIVEEVILPTAERMSKEDRPGRTKAGYRALGTIERLCSEGKLDPTPHIAFGMLLAAEKLYTHFVQCGLSGIRGPSLDSIRSGNGNGTAGFPASEQAMFNRQKFREAIDLMGWFIEAPHRGAGRLVVDVVCFGLGVKEAALIHLPGTRTELALAAGQDRLKEGLYALASHWKLFGSTHARMRASRDMSTEGNA